MSAAARMIEELAERHLVQAEADLTIARAAYDAGEITWQDLQDVASHVLLTVVPEFRSEPES